MWLVSKKDACQLQIKNIKNKNENITSYRFGVNLNVNVPLFVDVVVVDNLRNFKCLLKSKKGKKDKMDQARGNWREMVIWQRTMCSE